MDRPKIQAYCEGTGLPITKEHLTMCMSCSRGHKDLDFCCWLVTVLAAVVMVSSLISLFIK